MNDQYDGRELAGIADFRGRPHVYRCQFDHDIQEYSDRYWVMEIDEQLFSIAMDNYAIFSRWAEAFQNGKASAADFPSLPQDRERHRSLADRIGNRLDLDKARSVMVRAVFAHTDDGETLVEWFDGDNP